VGTNYALKIQCHIVKNIPLQTAFSAILTKKFFIFLFGISKVIICNTDYNSKKSLSKNAYIKSNNLHIKFQVISMKCENLLWLSLCSAASYSPRVIFSVEHLAFGSKRDIIDFVDHVLKKTLNGNNL